MRCFVAVDVPSAVRAALVDAQARLRRAAPRADVRWASPEQLHLTLAFLGEVAPDRVAGVAAALAAVAGRHAPIALRVAGLGCFPGPSRPRVVWAGVVDGVAPLGLLAADVRRALEPLGFVPEARPFRAHATLARVRSARGVRRLVAAVAAAGAPELGAWTAEDVVLYRSHLHPAGARYEALVRPRLAASGGGHGASGG